MKKFTPGIKSALLTSCAFIAVPAEVFAQEFVPAPVEEIVVSGQYIPDEKRSTAEIASVVDAEAMSLAGDGDIAVALTRLPGISPDSTGRYVVIRGLNERYTTTLLNGTQMPSPDPLKNSVPLDIFPTSMIGNVLVQKTYSAEYPGNFGGGVIDIRTKIAPDEPFFNIEVGTGFNTESTGKRGLSYDGSSTDILGFDSGKRDLPDIIAANPTLEGLTPEQLEQAGEAFPNVWSIDSEPNAPDFDFKLNGGSVYDVGDEGSLGFIFALDYGSAQRNRFGVQYTYSASAATESGLEGEQIWAPEACEAVGVTADDCGYRSTTWDIDLNTFLSVGYQINPSNSIQFTSLLLRSSQQQVEIRQGRTDSRDLTNQTRLDWKERQVWSNGLFGEHEVELFGDQFTYINWFATLVDASRDVPLRREFEYFFDEGDEAFELNRRTDGNQTSYGFLDDTSKDIGVNIEQPSYIGNLTVDFKLGASYNEKERSSSFLRYGFDTAQVRNRELFTLIPEIIFGSVNIDPQGITLREFIDASDAFDADFENKQAYLQADAQITDTIRVSGGMRYEDSTQIVSTTDRTTRQPIIVTQTTEAWLPSATLTWEFAENMQVRIGYSETINRPDSRELSPARFVREDGRTEEGNPNLDVANIKNYDARYEWYFGSGESLTVGAFYKEIDNPIEYSIASIGGEGQLDVVANADSAKLKGLEVEVEKILGEWGTREFFVKANGSYIDSDVVRLRENFGEVTNLEGRLQGQSKWLGNLQVGWQDWDTNERLNIILNYIGDRIYRLGTNNRPDLVETPPIELNFVYGRDVTVWGDRSVNVSFKARNLLNDSAERTQGSEIAEAYDVGRSFSLSLKVDF